MKTMNVRELRQATSRLEQTLAAEGEVLLVSNGRAVARILPVEAKPERTKLPSLKTFRATMPKMGTPVEVLIRQDRDRRGT